jgi:hypothetical protein
MRLGSVRFLVCLLLALVAGASFADNGSVQLMTVPAITVADGRSTVTVSAYVRRPSGQSVPDGTQVLFQSTLGEIKDSALVTTVSGVARVILRTGTVAGTAKITASALGIGAVTTMDIEFLSDRSLLSSANEYVEIVAPGYMTFAMDQRIVGAAGVRHGAKLRYREIVIEADDLQLNIPAYEVRAKKAHLKMGKVDQDFDELNLKLVLRKGVGMTTLAPTVPVTATMVGEIPWFIPTHARFGLAAIGTGGIAPFTGAVDPTQFKFEDLSESTSMVSAKKAVVFPQKKIQFQRANVIVGGVTVLKMPLYELPLNSASPIVTDSIFNINNSQLNINYPYYLDLKPGVTSMLRFTTGQQYGRSSGLNNGLSLGYEMAWNHGDEFDGGLLLSGTSSGTVDFSAHQYIRFDDRTSATALFEMPGAKSAFGSLNFNKQYNGWGLNMNGSSSRTLSGNRFDNNQFTFFAEKDPMKVGKFLRYSYGLTASASNSTTSLQNRSQSVIGLTNRLQLVPVKLGPSSQLNSYFTVTEQTGHNSIKGTAFAGDVTLSRQFGSLASAIISYDYFQNGFSSGLTGRHQLSLSGSLHQGNFGSTISASRALDIDKISLFADLGYQLGNLWRLSYSYTLDRYIGNTYADYTAALGYRIGFREIGLTFSGRTRRFGIQLLGAGLGH